MATKPPRVIARAGRLGRRVAITLIAGIQRRLGLEETEARIRALPARDQALITGATLLGLFLSSLLAAQFGLVGMALFFLAIVLIVG